jgi:hypothetical protein
MTEAQIVAVVGSGNMNSLSHIPGIRYVTFKKDMNVIKSDIRNVRFKFDTTNDILEVVYVRPFSQNSNLPPHGNYDTMDLDGVSTVFEYLTDVVTGDVVRDYFSFDSITTIGLGTGV